MANCVIVAGRDCERQCSRFPSLVYSEDSRSVDIVHSDAFAPIEHASRQTCSSATENIPTTVVKLVDLLSAVDAKNAELVERILSKGTPDVPVGCLHVFAGTMFSFSCPIHRLLKSVAGHFLLYGQMTVDQEKSSVKIMELLLEAGYRLTCFQKVWVSEEGTWDLPVYMHTFLPLQDKPQWFALDGRNRFVHATLRGTPWNIKSHQQYPSAFQAASRALLLTAHRLSARKRRDGAEPDFVVGLGCRSADTAIPCISGTNNVSVQHSVVSNLSSPPSGPPVGFSLGDLPRELVHRIVGLSAFPLSLWI